MVKPSSEYIHVDNCIIFEILNVRDNLVTVEAILFHLGVYNNGFLTTTYQPFRYVVGVLHINSEEQPLLSIFTSRSCKPTGLGGVRSVLIFSVRRALPSKSPLKFGTI